MPSYKIAHLKEQGVDMIIVPVESSFGSHPKSEQDKFILQFQLHCRGAKLAGLVVPVWEDSSGRMNFIAPPKWFPFFQGIDMVFVLRNLNREINW
jgi:hypothetical protein